MSFIVPFSWFLAHLFSSLAITFASTGASEVYSVEPSGIMFIQGLCVTQLATYCASNKLFFHYNQPE